MKKCYFCLSMLCFLTAGCGEFSYKRGATPTDLNNAQQTCKAQNSEAAAVEKCMEDSGWFVKKLDDANDEPLLAQATYSDNRDQDKRNWGNTLPEKPASRDGSSAPAATAADSPETGVSAAPAVAPVKKPADPLETFNVASWWKFGANNDALKPAIDACVNKLGDAYRPEPGSNIVTRGLILCMRESGWRGLQSK